MKEDEIDLTEYLKIVWKWKHLIVLGTLAVGIIAVIISLSLPKIYRATVIFLVTASPVVREPGKNPAVSETPYEILLETYRGLIKSKSSLVTALKKFKLDQNPYNFSLEKMEKLVSVKSIQNSKLVRLDVDLKDPQLATDIANFIATSAVELNIKLNQVSTIEAQKFLNDELNKAEQELKSSEKELLDFQKQARMADLRKQAEMLLATKFSFSQQLMDMEVNLSGEEGKLTTLDKEMKSRSPIISLNKSIMDDPSFQQLLSAISAPQQKDILHLSLKSEAINEAYGKMDQELVFSLGQVSQIRSKKKSLRDSLGKIDQELKTTQVILDKLALEEQRLSNRFKLASSVYQDFRQKLGEANINVVATSQDLKILDPAITPSQPIKPRKFVIVIVTFLVGGMGFVFFAFLLEYVKKIKEEGNVFL